MASIGVGEILVVMLVALLVFGPERLPEIMRNTGKAIRAFRDESQKAAAILKEGLEDKPAARAPGVIDLPDPQPVATPDLVPDGAELAEPDLVLPPEPQRAEPPPDVVRADVPESVRKYEDT